MLKLAFSFDKLQATSYTLMKKVFVGLSGGVDSAVSAALLKRAGYDVVGAFIKIWSPEFLECTWREDRLDAMRVCAALNIPFREIDLSREYREHVVGDMLARYRAGITPNPDVLCNMHIKFGAFLDWARAEGADMIATGHYAQKSECEHPYLLKGTDEHKDQSYFLHRITEAQLARAMFPVGDMRKSDVRTLAQEFTLPVAAKHDSQGLCFVGDVTLSQFIGRFMPLVRGDVVDTKGVVIGEHQGAVLYTLGQRHGFTTRNATPHYVVSIDVAHNRLVASERKEDAYVREVTLDAMHWIGDAPKLPLSCTALTRYHGEPHVVHLAQNRTLRAMFEEPVLATPGQSLVLYDRDRVLGGGIMAARPVHNR